MRRKVAVTWHASFSVVAAVLFYFFVLPRWPELTGSVSHTVGTVLRVVTGLVIALAAVPVLQTLLRSRRPELGTPQLALTLRTASVALHVAAGVLIIGTAVVEIWVSLDSAGQWIFGIYGAAAAIALLGMFAFWLSYVAEMPPPPPKPLKAKDPRARTRRRGRTEDSADTADTGDTAADEAVETPEGAEASDTAETSEPADEPDKTDVTADTGSGGDGIDSDEDVTADSDGDSAAGKLRNRRPSGKETPGKRRRRLRGGVAVED